MENITPNEQNIVETPAEQTPQSTTSKIVENVANKATDALVSTGKSLAKAGIESGAKAIGGSVTKAFAPLIMKILIGSAIAGAVAGGGAALIKHIKESDALKISDTPNVVEKIKQISEFTTYTYIEEFVIHDQKAEAKDASAIRTLFNKEAVADTLRSEIVIITRGVVRAGYDLAKIGTDDIKASNIAIEVTANGIALLNAEGKTITVYTPNGICVADIDNYRGEEITLEKGIYIVRVGNNTIKVII
jgi:hypothetical protein